jgi:hypothetical protein
MARVISSVAGTRTEPTDGYSFVKGTVATFKIIFENDGQPVKVDAGSARARILSPFDEVNNLTPQVLATLVGDFVPGQEFEYKFEWNIPVSVVAIDNYIISYGALLNGQEIHFGDEYFTVKGFAGSVGIKTPAYATVDDVRKHKFNIDSFLPEELAKSLTDRNQLIQEHLRNATSRLREELNLSKARGMSENYRLFTIYYTIWSIMLAARGEDGSSVSQENLQTWRAEWERILAQEKREGVFQGIPVGRG